MVVDGEDIMVPCVEEDVKPDHNYYMVNVMKPNVFYETHFSPLVEWETVLTLIKYKRIWRLKDGVLA